MNEIKCPQCGNIFKIDDNVYESIVKQIKDKELKREVEILERQYKSDKENSINLLKMQYDKEKSEDVKKYEIEINNLKNSLKMKDTENELILKNSLLEKEKEIDSLSTKLESNRNEYLMNSKNLKDNYEEKIRDKEEQIAYYKDFKARQSTKMVGESLEQHCNFEFNKIRPLFGNAYFEKDNDAKTGSKGDFIFREKNEEDIEFISIMFEMKNENDETATKHKNEDFFKELDKDRKEKKCEYAVLVSMLEMDNDYYNTGIVDVSHKYEKMYVIRPQFFIPLITILRNASIKSLKYKKELEIVKSQEIDISNFEENMNSFKEGFARNYRLASDKFSKAIEEIDKSIDHLQKIKDALQSSENNLRLANNKADDLTIKRLTQNSPTMAKLFEESNKE